MNFIDEFNSFLFSHGLPQDGTFLPVPVCAATPEEAAVMQEKIAGLAGNAVYIVEDRWYSQGDAVRARMLAHGRVFRQVYARNCEARRIDKAVASEFLSRCHSYGDAACRYRYGLFVKRKTGEKGDVREVAAGELVAVAEFSSARKWMKENGPVRSYEWVRYASLPEVRVVGGMGKLLDAFVEQVKPDDVMSYADLEWSDGEVYRTLGFVLEGTKDPVMFAVDPSDWSRTALKPPFEALEGKYYYLNLGSLKYRKKYTEL
ncbi:MAG: hypothetical protein Q4G10_02420 [Bacteroidia bacterium]|nr:hypothetical protein [Bacteroidia bacterium]